MNEGGGLTFTQPPPNKHVGAPSERFQNAQREQETAQFQGLSSVCSSSSIDESAGPSGSESPQQRLPLTAVSSGPRPTANDACASIVTHLMIFNLSKDEEFSRKACESLIKKMKDKRGELDALILAVSTLGNNAEQCVTIQRTLDGRLQVAGRKGFPHVVYAKIWRWPDLHKNELKHLPVCKNAFDLKCDTVCVNPYHYERVLSPAINNLDLSGLKLDSIPHSHDEDDGVDESCSSSTLVSPSSNSQTTALHQHQQQQQQQRFGQQIGSSYFTNQQGTIHVRPTSDLTGMGPPMQPSPSQLATQKQPSGLVGQKEIPLPPGITNGQIFPNPKPGGPPLRYLDGAVHPVSVNLERNRMPEPPTAEVQSNWCAITYHEKNEQLGETMQIHRNEITVDNGFATDPCRFCIGAIPNINRTPEIAKMRCYVSEGIRLSVKNTGDCWLECKSRHSVFVTSFYLDRESGRSGGDAIHKIYPGASLKVFDLRQCQQQLKSQASYQMLAREVRAGNHPAGDLMGNMSKDQLDKAASIGIDDLRRACVIRVSFIKGWGPDYPRKDIIETPVWIEIHMNKALEILDRILHEPGMMDHRKEDD